MREGEVGIGSETKNRRGRGRRLRSEHGGGGEEVREWEAGIVSDEFKKKGNIAYTHHSFFFFHSQQEHLGVLVCFPIQAKQILETQKK